ncbi:hypothetical protein BASA83_001897 [Batrachochytrium salamandrivorans]|nr:hypothetical protein BASA83_001897 [Batrachochytrium salamandrivorans]
MVRVSQNPDTTSTLPVDHISNLNVDSDGEDTSSVYSKSHSLRFYPPFTATSDDLEEFFSQIDAQKALVDLKKQKFMGGRTLKMKIALRKSVVVQRKSEGVPVNAEEIVDMEIQAKKDLLKMKRKLKQSPCWPDQKQLYKKVRKFGDVGDLQFPMDNSATADYQDCARVIYKDEESTRRAQKQLNEHKYKGATIKSVIDSAIKQPIPRARLIIRNLASTANQKIAERLFGFGPIKECTVPHLPDGKARGLDLLNLKSWHMRNTLYNLVNGTKILNRPVAVDWAIAKATYDRLAALPDAANDENGQEITMDDDDSDDDHSENEDDIEITMDDGYGYYNG